MYKNIIGSYDKQRVASKQPVSRLLSRWSGVRGWAMRNEAEELETVGATGSRSE